MPIITVDNLVKDFHRPKRFDDPLGGIRTLLTRQVLTIRAVDGVSFTVGEGELVGLFPVALRIWRRQSRHYQSAGS